MSWKMGFQLGSETQFLICPSLRVWGVGAVKLKRVGRNGRWRAVFKALRKKMARTGELRGRGCIAGLKHPNRIVRILDDESGFYPFCMWDGSHVGKVDNDKRVIFEDNGGSRNES